MEALDDANYTKDISARVENVSARVKMCSYSELHDSLNVRRQGQKGEGLK